MVRPALQKWIVEKCLREQATPFAHADGRFTWSGQTRIKSKKTERIYPIDVTIQIETDDRIHQQLMACLCRTEGVRLADLEIAHLVGPRLQGLVRISGLPQQDLDVDFGKFMKSIAAAES